MFAALNEMTLDGCRSRADFYLFYVFFLISSSLFLLEHKSSAELSLKVKGKTSFEANSRSIEK